MHSKGDDIIAKAKEYVDVRYKHLGRSILGLDCIGLIIRVANDLGITDYDTVGYSRRPNLAEFHRELKNELVAIPLASLGNGDVVLMNEPRWPCHVGFYEVDEKGEAYIIHAWAVPRRVLREKVGPARRQKFIRAYRFPE